MGKMLRGSMILAALGMGICSGRSFGQAAPAPEAARGQGNAASNAPQASAPPPAVATGGAMPGATPPASVDAGVPAPMTINQLVQRSGGSLARAAMPAGSNPATATISSVSFLAVPEAKPKLMRKHDLLTIIVREDSNFSSVGDTNLQHQSDVDAKITSFVKMQWQPFGTLTGVIPTNPLEVAGNGQRDFKSQATVDRTDSMTARITAAVVDVKPNGTLVIQASETIKTDEEVQTMVLLGTCRVDDVTPDNTVLSNQLYDLTLTKTHTGAVRDTTERGFIPRLLDSLNPF